MIDCVTEHVVRTPRHTSFYLACGPADGPLAIFVHGWPELSISWRHQLPVFGALGFRAIAPDMRGYGRSTVHARHEDYALAHAVDDMLELLAHLGRESAVWIGHDWGAPVVWHVASHHPQKCRAVAALCLPYLPAGIAPSTLIPLVDRTVYAEGEFPAGQWDYQLYYEQQFERATAVFDANVANTVKCQFRRGDPNRVGKPSLLASISRHGGWFGGKPEAPDVPLDTGVLTEAEFHQYSSALQRNGFFGPDAWYMNAERNLQFAQRAANGGRLGMPVLFLHAAYDTVCETLRSRLAEPMRQHCERLSETTVASGHWMAQERPREVNAALLRWLATEVPAAWPEPPLNSAQ